MTIAPATDFRFVQLSTGLAGQMARNTPTIDSISGSCPALLTVDFDASLTNTNYVVNDIDSLLIDTINSNALNLLLNTTPIVFASAVFNVGSTLGSSVIPSFGVDGDNDFTCGGSSVTCDLQMQMNTTLVFEDHEAAVPEPTTMLLIGLGLAGLGFARRRRLNA